MFLSRLALFASVATAVIIPGPPGPYSVTLKVQTFEDAERWDPYAPEDQPEKRRVLASIFVPRKDANCTIEVVPYMPPATAAIFGLQAASYGLPDDITQSLELELCEAGQTCTSKNKYPLVFFSPGRGGSRLMYNILARSLASYGYVVVALDHTYDTAIIEFPDGSVRYVANSTNNDRDYVEGLVQARQEDVSFIIDQFANPSVVGPIFAGTQATVDLDRIFVFGHSLGGATAASSVYADDRVLGGLNLDGMMNGPVTSEGTDKPFVVAGTPSSRGYIPSWNETWENLRGPALLASINGTTHMSFIDAPQLPTVLALPAEYGPLLDAIFGTTDGKTIGKVVIELVRSALGFVFDGKTDGICNVENIAPEVDQVEIKGLSCS